MNATETRFDRYADEYGIELGRAFSHGRQVDSDGWEHNSWDIELTRFDGETTSRWTTPWRQGTGIAHPPRLGDILESLSLDALGAENAETFEEWADEYGYDADSRKAEAIFEAVKTQVRGMRRFLGEDAYRALLEVES